MILLTSTIKTFDNAFFIAGCGTLAYQYIKSEDSQAKTSLLKTAIGAVTACTLARQFCPKDEFFLIKGAIEGAFFAYTIGTLVHECGHRAALHLFFRNMRSSIEYMEDGDGCCRYEGRFELSRIGSAIGNNLALVGYSGGGPLVDTIIAAVANSMVFRENWRFLKSLNSHRFFEIEQSESNLRKISFLFAVGSLTLSRLISYAESAREPQNKEGHDFENMWKLGLNPNVAITLIFAVNIIACGLGAAW